MARNDPKARARSRELAELGWRCVFDSWYMPYLNKDAEALFSAFPNLFEWSGTAVWCQQPGLAVLAAFRMVRLDKDRPPSIVVSRLMSESFSESAIVALTDASGADKAAEAIVSVIKDKLPTPV